MDKKVYSVDGKEKKVLKLEDSVFAVTASMGSVYHAIRNELANRRVGTSCTKTRSEVNLRHQKPYRQKGTGRARAGRTNSPIWVGGGVAFGPKPRDYSYTLPKKIKRLAIKSILSMHAATDCMSIVEDFTVDSGKTKDLVAILKNFFQTERAVVVMKDDDKMLRRAGRNLPNVRFLAYNRLEAHELFYAKKMLVLETAAVRLGEFYTNVG